jgi:hypothetical protein
MCQIITRMCICNPFHESLDIPISFDSNHLTGSQEECRECSLVKVRSAVVIQSDGNHLVTLLGQLLLQFSLDPFEILLASSQHLYLMKGIRPELLTHYLTHSSWEIAFIWDVDCICIHYTLPIAVWHPHAIRRSRLTVIPENKKKKCKVQVMPCAASASPPSFVLAGCKDRAVNRDASWFLNTS